MDEMESELRSGNASSVERSNGRRDRPPSPPPVKSSRHSRSPSPRDRRNRSPYSRSYDRDSRFGRRGNFSRNRNRSRSPEYRGRDRRSRSTSRGRRGYSPRRRPHTPTNPPPSSSMNQGHVPAYVPQQVYAGDQYQYGYVPQQHQQYPNMGFDQSGQYMVGNNPYIGGPAVSNYGAAPPPPVLNPEYMQGQQQWGAPLVGTMMGQQKPINDGRIFD